MKTPPWKTTSRKNSSSISTPKKIPPDNCLPKNTLRKLPYTSQKRHSSRQMRPRKFTPSENCSQKKEPRVPTRNIINPIQLSSGKLPHQVALCITLSLFKFYFFLKKWCTANSLIASFKIPQCWLQEIC